VTLGKDPGSKDKYFNANLAVFTPKNPTHHLLPISYPLLGTYTLSEENLHQQVWKMQRIGRIGICVEQKLISSYLMVFAWVVDDAKCIVVTRVCVTVRGRMPTLMHGPGCNFREWCEMPPSCALFGGFAIAALVALLWQDNTKAKC